MKDRNHTYLISQKTKQKLAFGFLKSDTSGRSVDVEIYDDKMRLLWEKPHNLNVNNDAYIIKGYCSKQ